ncbi:MAG: MotA/TolQ/ExbB proton channel family protein [Pirellulales bacterium]
MLHELMRRLAQYGGEGSMIVLAIVSIVNVAGISERAWYFFGRRMNVDRFARQLVAALRSGDTNKAQALLRNSTASITAVAAAGLAQAERGLTAARDAMVTAVARERVLMEDKVLLLSELAKISVWIGITGGLLDLIWFGSQLTLASAPAMTSARVTDALVRSLAPVVAGLLVALPAWMCASVLKVYVQRRLLECEFVARLVSSQLARTPGSTEDSRSPTARAA